MQTRTVGFLLAGLLASCNSPPLPDQGMVEADARQASTEKGLKEPITIKGWDVVDGWSDGVEISGEVLHHCSDAKQNECKSIFNLSYSYNDGRWILLKREIL
jgi:hypothetical protein